MAWITPKTDWGPESTVTYDDMNRIGGNINYLLDAAVVKDDYTASDFVYATEWAAIVSALEQVQELAGMDPELPDYTTSSYNFNLVETILEAAKDPIDLMRLQHLANKYSGEWYADTEIYAGGY